MLKTLKRHIALVAVSVLGASGLAVVAAPSANAVAATPTTAVSTSAPGVRVSFTNSALDKVGVVPLTITNASTYGIGSIVGGDQATITLTSAPSAVAKLVVAATAATGQVGDAAGAEANFSANDSNARVLTLAAATNSIEGIPVVTATGGTSKIWVAADIAGTYTGTILLDNAADAGQTSAATFSITTTGAPASFELSSTAQSVPAGGRSQWNATVKDANGNATILGIFDSIGVTGSPAIEGGAGAVNSLVDSVAAGDGTVVPSITAARIAAGNGTAGVNFRASGVAGGVTTLSFKALGVIAALGTQTATVTETAQVISTDLIIATPTITTTPVATTVTGTAGGVNGWTRSVSVKTGTSAITVGFTAPAAGLGEEFRFAIISNAGTVDGTAYTTTVYKTATADAVTGKGSISFTLGGAALLSTGQVIIRQVNVVNTKVAPADNAAGLANATLGDIRGNLLTIEQDPAEFVGAGITTTPEGSVVAKLGATTEITVSLANTYEEPLGAGNTVRVYRGATLLGSAVTAADGTAKVSVTNATTLTTAGSETYTFEVQPVFGTAVAAADSLDVNYTTTGAVTSLSVAITNTTGTGGGATTPITNASLASSVLRIPVVYIPSDGYVSSTSSITRILATSTVAAADSDTATGALIGATTAGEYFTLVASPSVPTPVTWTGSDGVRFCSSTTAALTATGCAWDTGKDTITAASTARVHVYSLKTGTQTVTAAVGDVKATLSFVARNRVIDGYNIILTPATQSLDSGAYGTVNVKVTDIFGNAVAAAAGDVTVSVTGPALLSGLAASASPATTATTGADLTVIASSTGSGDATVAAAPGAATAATAWGTTYIKPTNAPDPIKAASAKVTVKAAAASAAQTAETTAIKADVKAVSDTVATLSKAVTTVQSSVTELTSSFATQIKSLTDAIAKISRAIAAIQKSLKKK